MHNVPNTPKSGGGKLKVKMPRKGFLDSSVQYMDGKRLDENFITVIEKTMQTDLNFPGND